LSNQSTKVTELLLQWGNGNSAALDALMPLVYAELRRRAGHSMRSERHGHTLQPTALVHEAYLRLVNQERISFQNRAQFFALASEVIRHILVDHARARRRNKRVGAAVRVTWIEELDVPQPNGLGLIELDEALQRLSELDHRQGRIVELRFFGGLSNEETAEALNVSAATVKRDWRMARAWLCRELTSR
jgi:RNA polymerase sigma factor (TIGR02999 family)